MFVYARTVRFHEVDGAGILYFNRILQYCHEAYEAFLDESGLPIAEVLAEGGWGTPLVKAEASFAAPCRLGERLRITLSVERVGETSVTYAYRVEAQDGALRATARLVHVSVDRGSFRPIPHPEALRRILDKASGIG